MAIPLFDIHTRKKSLRERLMEATARTFQLGNFILGNKVYYRPQPDRHPALAPYAEGVELPVTDELGLTHLAIVFGRILTAADAEKVTARLAEVGA